MLESIDLISNSSNNLRQMIEKGNNVKPKKRNRLRIGRSLIEIDVTEEKKLCEENGVFQKT